MKKKYKMIFQILEDEKGVLHIGSHKDPVKFKNQYIRILADAMKVLTQMGESKIVLPPLSLSGNTNNRILN